jgi:hypothetical protein
MEQLLERLIHDEGCCFMARLSATMALAPPGPRRFASVVKRWASNSRRPLMGGQGREACCRSQDCLSYRFQIIIMNSPPSASTGRASLRTTGLGRLEGLVEHSTQRHVVYITGVHAKANDAPREWGREACFR